MKVGDKVVWSNAMDTPILQEGTITKLSKDTFWVDGKHKEEDQRYLAFAWPAQAREDLLGVLKERARLRKAFDDSIGLVYQLRNRVARGEYGTE